MGQVFAQPKKCIVVGRVLDENFVPVEDVTIQVLSKYQNVSTDSIGRFTMTIKATQVFALVASKVGYFSERKKIVPSSVDTIRITFQLQKNLNELTEVIIKDERDRREAGRIDLNPGKSILNPSPVTGIEGLIKVLVGTNNELTSQYSVRGGSYDENLVYVNDFEIYRPYLVSNGQQEGLSFINPSLTSNVKFFNGGFQSKYGDKMSSVLDITYQKPKKRFAGSSYIGLLEQGVHVEGISASKKWSYLLGVRNRNNGNLLSGQSTTGIYIPASQDVQALVTYVFNPTWSAELFTNLSATKFTFFPEASKLTSSVFTPLYSANLGLDVYYQGQERDKYSTQFIGVSVNQQLSKKSKIKYLFSYFENNEQENYDITGAYIFGARDFDNNSSTFGNIVNPLGSGAYQNYARNQLNISITNFTIKGNLDKNKHAIQWGLGVDKQEVKDKLNQWKLMDSAGFTIPVNPTQFIFTDNQRANNELSFYRYQGYVQDNFQVFKEKQFFVQAGVRFNYNTLNQQLLVSPRLGISFKPKQTQSDIIYKASVGLYSQPPFYREMRRNDGSLNTNLMAQQSFQASIGIDKNFKLNEMPAKWTFELYYKNMWQVIPYDQDNVRLQYFAENRAQAYAIGAEARFFTQIVKDAESWISIGLMETKEKIDNFNFQQYFNAAGELITQNTKDKVIADSQTLQTGWFRRPTDRRLTIGFLIQDYLTTNKNFKVFFNAIYGSNMPYNIPGSVKYRNALTLEPYIRFDIGFSALLLDREVKRIRSHSPFKGFESIWATFEVFNVIDRANTISYQLVKDFQNNTFAMPNRLTPRMLNFKIAFRW